MTGTDTTSDPDATSKAIANDAIALAKLTNDAFLLVDKYGVDDPDLAAAVNDFVLARGALLRALCAHAGFLKGV